MSGRATALLRSLLAVETAPFREQELIAHVTAWAGGHGLSVDTGAAGNLWVGIRPPGALRPPRPVWVFQAHLDHPGFVVQSSQGRWVHAQFRGGVEDAFFPCARVRLFTPAGSAFASVSERAKVGDEGFGLWRLALETDADVPAGTIGMWDLPPMRVEGTRVASRACDDLAGVGAVLSALEVLSRGSDPAPVTALLTRGEEAGLVGAVAACAESGRFADARIVSVETSKELGGARLGDGVVIRVGDRVSVFDPLVTGHLAKVAAGLTEADQSFRHVRQLMSGGVCESTVFWWAGLPAGALCLPLANYHNMGDDGRIRPECIDLEDYESLVKLLTAVGRCEPPAPDARVIPRRLREIHDRRAHLFGGA